jgi:hypothetical protein
MEAETHLPLPHDTFLTAWETRWERTEVTSRCDKGESARTFRDTFETREELGAGPALAKTGPERGTQIS